ncbi:MAG: SH3 domain-containing protein [Deltaproteobacteria bacterium]|nr:SH3 domain-containing protein [Deltaproteobacteria bacterium]
MKTSSFREAVGSVAIASIALFLLYGCESVRPAPKAEVTTPGGPSIQEAQSVAYDGPQARIAITRFTDKTGKGWWTGAIGDGMADMLATALFHSNRFIVLERQQLGDVLQEQDLAASGRIRRETAAPIGQIEGAELLITGAVTEFEGAASGARGGIGGWGGGVIGAIAGGFKKAHMAIDVRVIDTRTSRIVAATSVEGEATDVNLGAALGGAIGGGALGGALGGWSKTPTEKALRICIKKAVDFIVSKTPAQYYHYGQGGAAVRPAAATSAPTPPAPPAPRAQDPTVEVMGTTVNIRSGPGTNHGIIGSVRRGDRLTLLGESGNWFQVRLPDGKEGWIYNKLVK